MAFWLFKQEPDCFSYTDLEKAGATVWDGVRNPAAQKHLRAAAVGDQVFFYHTGDEKAVVGVMTVSAGPRPDPADATKVVVDVKPVRRLKAPVTLAAIKADGSFADWELCR
jgi:predicted RNA-binding protein with PUA-like domain